MRVNLKVYEPVALGEATVIHRRRGHEIVDRMPEDHLSLNVDRRAQWCSCRKTTSGIWRRSCGASKPRPARKRSTSRSSTTSGVEAATFSSRFFGPQGELRRLAASHEERRRILSTELYRWLKAEYTRLRQEDADQFEKDLKAGPSRPEYSSWGDG